MQVFVQYGQGCVHACVQDIVSVCLSDCVHLSICLSVCLFVCLSVQPWLQSLPLNLALLFHSFCSENCFSISFANQPVPQVLKQVENRYCFYIFLYFFNPDIKNRLINPLICCNHLGLQSSFFIKIISRNSSNTCCDK